MVARRLRAKNRHGINKNPGTFAPGGFAGGFDLHPVSVAGAGVWDKAGRCYSAPCLVTVASLSDAITREATHGAG